MTDKYKMAPIDHSSANCVYQMTGSDIDKLVVRTREKERTRCAEIARAIKTGPVYYVEGRPNAGSVVGGDIIADAIMKDPGQ